MTNSKRRIKRSNAKKPLIKPVNHNEELLINYLHFDSKDKGNSSSKKNAFNCSHDYCLAKKNRIYGSEEEIESQKPVGLPWASGHLKYLPGQVKVKFPLRKKLSLYHPKKTSSIVEPSVSMKLDEIHNLEFCSIFDEMIHAYKVFILAGMVISEAKAEAEAEDEKNRTYSALS